MHFDRPTVRTLGIFALSSLVITLGCGGSSPAEDLSLTSSSLSASGTPITSGFAGKCLDDRSDRSVDGNPIQLYACNGTNAQSWQYTNGTFVGPGGKCLDVTADRQQIGTVVQLYACNGTNAQKWAISGSTLKSFGGLCLSVVGTSGASESPVELATCDGSTGQVWHADGTAPAPPSPPAPPPTPTNTKSIREWVTCDGKTDDALGAAAAFAAAKNKAFTLLVDCPVFLHIGSDPTRPIFIDNGTTVTFQAPGQFIVDNVLEPAFAIMNSSDITLSNWNIVYTGVVSVEPPAGTGPGGQWNDTAATQWLSKNRGITGAHSLWQGFVNTAALFFIAGSSSEVTLEGLTATASSVTAGEHFIPCVVALAADWKDNQTVSAQTATNIIRPSGLKFDDITLDGTIMGWVGNVTDSSFTNITSKHYGDLEDANGENTGGVGKWFAPPHLFYFNNHAVLGNNTNLTFANIIDAPTAISAGNNGDRVGVARDTTSVASGVIYSLKLACENCTVTNYTSNRADGFMDALDLTNTVLDQVTVTFNSEFTHGLYPGIRFPQPYDGLTYSHMTITDVASTSVNQPIGSSATQSGLLFENVDIYMNSLEAGLSPFATNGNQAASSLRTYYIAHPMEVIQVGPNGKLN